MAVALLRVLRDENRLGCQLRGGIHSSPEPEQWLLVLVSGGGGCDYIICYYIM